MPARAWQTGTVIIAQLVLPGASEYERKSQRIDFASLAAEHDVRFGEIANADIVHIYAPHDFDPKAVRDIGLPYVSNARPKARRFRKSVQPHRVITPLKETAGTFIPEAVEEIYFRGVITRCGWTLLWKRRAFGLALLT